MGNEPSADERAAVQRFVHDLYEQSGCRTWAEFARLVGVSEYSLSEWRSGRGMPNAPNLLRLFTKGRPTPEPQEWPAALQEELEGLAAEVRRLADLLDRRLGRLSVDEAP